MAGESTRSPRSALDDFRRLLVDAGGNRLSRRAVIKRGVALGLSVPAITAFLAACGDDDDDDTGETSATSTTSTTTGGATATAGTSGGQATTAPGEAQSGGTLTLIVTGNVPDLDPQSAYDSTASAVFFGTHEMLVRLKGSDTFDYEPMLAESWESNEDFSEWTFKIPDGVTFHDGTDCDAAAVVASFQRFHQMGLGPVNVITRFVDSPDDMTAPDKNTVVFTLNTGNEVFIAALASQYGPLVVSPAEVEAHKTADDPWAHEWVLANPVGTGPYKFKEYLQNDSIVLERFEDYHKGWDGPHFDTIVYRIVEESSTRRQLVESGEGDALTQSLTPEDVVNIEEAGELNVIRYDSTNADWVTVNYVRVADPKVREALAWAYPYNDVRDGVYRGLYQRTSGPNTPTTRGYPTDGFIFDTGLEQARTLIEESGFDTSQTLEYWLSASSASGQASAQLFQANLAEIGITMEIVQKEEGALTEFNYGEAPAEERPHFVSWGWWPDYNDAWNEIYPNFHTESIVPNGSNIMYYSNAEVDKLLDSVALGAPEAEYNKAIADINDILVRTDPAAIFIGALQWYTVIQRNIQGFVPNPIYINTYNVYDMYRTEG
jgi:peptide/nickel transport system substrate-binding protein